MNYYIAQAVLARIRSDTGSGGLYVSSSFSIITGAYYYRASNNATRPYVVYNITQDTDSTLTSDACEFTLTFRIVDNGSAGGDVIQTVWNRLYGDSMLQSGRTPSYGFNRHRLTLPTNPLSAACSDLSFDGSTDIIDTEAETIEWEMRFRGRWDAASVSP